MPKEKRHTPKAKRTFYKDVVVTHNKIIYRKNGEVLGYGSLTNSKYPFIINNGSVVYCYDECGKYIRKFMVLMSGKPTKNYFGFKGTKIKGSEFFEIQQKNRTGNVKTMALALDVESIIKQTFNVIKNKNQLIGIKSNYAIGTKLWCNDIASKAGGLISVPSEIIKQTLINIYDE